MLDGLKHLKFISATSLPFIRIHLCLAFVMNDRQLGCTVKDIFNQCTKMKDASLGAEPGELNEIQNIFKDLAVSKIYNQILKHEVGN